MVATTGRSPLYRTNPKPVLLKFLICVLGLVMANASGRAEAPTAPQPSTLPAARALDELPGSDELGKLQAALAQIKENLERRNLTAAELQGHLSARRDRRNSRRRLEQAISLARYSPPPTIKSLTRCLGLLRRSMLAE